MAHNTTASTSTSNSSAPNYFQIFINHRGCDVKKTFASHLYWRLTNLHGLRVFLDRRELEAGKKIISQIEEAIQEASIQIAIFSKNYADSKWCLDELRLMVDSEKRGATILPIFYNIKPSDLRWADAAQQGPYAQALRKHEEKERYDPRRIQGWREALSHVANISGFELEACNGDEVDLVNKVVERVLTVPKPALHLAKYATNSSAPYSAPNHFHIFINHRCCDVKKTFTAHLYRRLTSHGLQVFFDWPNLEPGKAILSQIEAAIQVASVHIPILSENYANSKCCLDELRLMVDSGVTILPVFYNIKPSDLQWADAAQQGPYAQALLKDEEKGRYDPRRIQGWREALSQVAKISGFELEACNGDAADLLDKVVKKVLTKVPKPAFHVAKYETGLREKIQDFEKTVSFQLEQQPMECKVVAIAGVGGVGKTTLAKKFFNSKRSGYGCSSFLADVREKASRASLPSLQSQLIKDLKGISRGIDNWEEGIEILQTCLSSCQALIVIDDVDDADQLDALLPIKGVLHPKSLILVTSRDKHVLGNAGIGKSSIYHLKGLNEPHSQQLFCSYAFFQPHPRQGFENLVDRFVKSCDGLPLSLKVFGALLCGQDQPYWKKKLKELRKLPDKILASLKISYNSLNQEEQQIFLDIACFAIGEDRDKWVRIWGGFTGLQTLEDRCLVEVKVVDEDYGEKMKEMRMHDHVRDMGRNIAEREISMPRRLWRSVEVVHDLFEEQSLSSVIPDIRGIRMPTHLTKQEQLLRTNSEIPLNKISSEPAIKMRTLQLLESEGEFVEGIIRRVRSPNLVWLRWNKCPCSSLPTWIPMGQLKVLEVSGPKLKKLWRRDSQAPLQLRELYVHDAPLLEFPKSIGKLTHLEKIVFRNFNYSTRPGPADLSTLAEEFFHLRSLKYLELHGRFKILPKEFGNLTNLQSVVLSGCQRMEKLPDSFTDLTNLQVLQLSHCNSLKRLPKSLGDLTNIQRISLYGCMSLELLPNSFANLANLQVLELSDCNSLKRLPKSLGDLTNLQRISLDGCRSLELLPNSFANLANLQDLYLSGCNRLKWLPNSLGDLTNLQIITLTNCEGLEVLPESIGCLTNLLRIELTGCKRLKNLPDSFTGLTSLRHIKLVDSDKLKRLPKSLGCLTNLQYINLSNCKSLKELPNSLGDLTNLQEIRLDKCESLEVLPDSFGNLKNLQRTTLQDSGLKTLPDSFQHLTNLVSIDLGACRSLMMLPNNLFGNLTNLKTVGLSGCESLEKLPHFLGNLTELRSIQLNDCKSLKKLPKSLGELTNLRGIDLSGCKSLKKLPNWLGELTNLRGIDLSGCKSLKKLPKSLGNLSQLRFLDLSHCSRCSIALPGNITTLQFLGLSGCVQMAALPAQVEHQKSLVGLNLLATHLKELTINAQIACLSNLKYLFLGSPLLEELPPSFGCLLSLEVLLLHGCHELKRLPDSVGLLTQLTTLEISKCGIQELPDLMEMNNLRSLRVRDCPLRELPFKESSAPRRKRKRRASEKGLIRLREIELYCTEVREVSFPEGVCINLRTLSIMCCNDLVKVGSLPATVERLILRGCGALEKIEELFGLAEPLSVVDLRGCCNIEMGEVPHFGNTTRLFIPTDTYNLQQEEEVEEELAGLQEGVLLRCFASRVRHMKWSALDSEF